MPIKNVNDFVVPDVSVMPLVADVQAYEPYATKALNRQMRGVIQPGIYAGFEVTPAASGLNVVASSTGTESAAAIQVGTQYMITVHQQADVTLEVPAGRTSVIVLTAFYDGETDTNQVNANSATQATQLLAVDVGSEPADSVILCEVVVPSGATAITADMISYDRRDRVSLEGFWNKIADDVIQPKGQWFRSVTGKGFLPSADNTDANAVDYVGQSNSWFKEAWFNSYRGGSIDVTGTIKSGGILALLRGDNGFAGKAISLAAGVDLNNLAAESAFYVGSNLVNTPDGNLGWWYIEQKVPGANTFQVAYKITGNVFTGAYTRTCQNGVWTEWDHAYSPVNKPLPVDLGAADRAHTHAWSDLTGLPEYATRWPTATEVGLGNVPNTVHDSAATASTVVVRDGNANISAHTLKTDIADGTTISGALAYRVSSGSADSYLRFCSDVTAIKTWLGAANAVHTHAWSDLTGIPAYASRWPSAGELSNASIVMYFKGAIPSGADLNTYTTAGIYHCASGGYASAGANFPEAQAGLLEVYESGVFYYQTYTTYGPLATTWKRTYYNGTWYNWYKTYDTGHKPTYTDVGAAPTVHTHAWSDLTGLPAYATRWPTASEVGLGNVPNTVHTTAATASTVAVRDSSADLTVRTVRTSYADQTTVSGAMAFRTNASTDNYLRFCSDVTAIKTWLGAANAVHTHAWSDLTGVPTSATRWPTWSEVTSKPTTFTPAAHTHAWADIASGLPTYATRWPAWTEVTSKPSTFAPSAHTHAWADLTGLPAYATRWPSASEISNSVDMVYYKGTLTGTPDLNSYTETGAYACVSNTVAAAGTNFPNAYAGLLEVYQGGSTAFIYQRYTTYSNNDGVYHRQNYNGTWTSWFKHYDTGHKPSYSDVGAAASSHTHAWSQITGLPTYATRWPTWSEVTSKPSTFAPSAHTHAWSDLTSVPTSFTPSAHTHAWADLTGLPSYATRWPTWSEVTSKPSTFTPSAHTHSDLSGSNYVGGGYEIPSYFGSGKMRYQMLGNGNTYGGVPGASYSDCIWVSAYAGSDVKGSNIICMDKYGLGRIGFRQQAYDATTWGAFNELYHTGNKPSYSDVGAAASSHTHAWSQITGLPTYATRWPTWTEVTSKPSTFAPSAHTHAWADLTGLPTYATRWPAWSEVTSKPTTFTPAAHTHAWADLTGLPAYATRWPTASEVGLGNVPNTVHTTAATASTVAVRDSSGDINVRLVRPNFADQTTVSGAMAFRVNASTDNYIRFCSDTAAIRTWLGVAAAAHTHAWSDITGLPTYATRWPTWSEVTSKPSTFTPATHTHTWSQITSIPAYASRWPSWSEVSSKPTTFPPSAHSHSGTMSFTLLLGTAVASGNFTLSAPYSNYDGLIVIAGGDDSSYGAVSNLPTPMLDTIRSLGLDVCLLQSDGIRFRGRFSTNNQSFTTTSENAKVHRIYGYKYAVS